MIQSNTVNRLGDLLGEGWDDEEGNEEDINIGLGC